MTKLVFGNKDYVRHMTDEGSQLQDGLRLAGWKMAGRGLEIDEVSVPKIIDDVRPSAVFFQDVRDWSADSPGCYDKSVSFTEVDRIADCDVFRSTVVKDAGTAVAYQEEFFNRIKAHAAVTYYHERSVVPLSPWLANTKLIRTYHTVDPELVRSIRFCTKDERRHCLVSGAVSGVYPLRRMAVRHAAELGCDILRHPGYNNNGAVVRPYLEKLANYRVHIATASRYGFALRKIIESVCMGCMVVTDLPRYDELPEIEPCIIRVSPSYGVPELSAAISVADAMWDEDRMRYFAETATAHYDYKRIGMILSDKLANAAAEHLKGKLACA